jgi:hypothetical protein
MNDNIRILEGKIKEHNAYLEKYKDYLAVDEVNEAYNKVLNNRNALQDSLDVLHRQAEAEAEGGNWFTNFFKTSKKKEQKKEPVKQAIPKEVSEGDTLKAISKKQADKPDIPYTKTVTSSTATDEPLIPIDSVGIDERAKPDTPEEKFVRIGEIIKELTKYSIDTTGGTIGNNFNKLYIKLQSDYNSLDAEQREGLSEQDYMLDRLESIYSYRIEMPEIMLRNKGFVSGALATLEPLLEMGGKTVTDINRVGWHIINGAARLFGKEIMTDDELNQWITDSAIELGIIRDPELVRQQREMYPNLSYTSEATASTLKTILEMAVLREVTGITSLAKLLPLHSAIKNTPSVLNKEMSTIDYATSVGSSALIGLLHDQAPSILDKTGMSKKITEKLELMSEAKGTDIDRGIAIGLLGRELARAGTTAAAVTAGSAGIRVLENAINGKDLGDGLQEYALTSGAISILYSSLGLYELNQDLSKMLRDLDTGTRESLMKEAASMLIKSAGKTVVKEEFERVIPIDWKTFKHGIVHGYDDTELQNAISSIDNKGEAARFFAKSGEGATIDYIETGTIIKLIDKGYIGFAKQLIGKEPQVYSRPMQSYAIKMNGGIKLLTGGKEEGVSIYDTPSPKEPTIKPKAGAGVKAATQAVKPKTEAPTSIMKKSQEATKWADRLERHSEKSSEDFEKQIKIYNLRKKKDLTPEAIETLDAYIEEKRLSLKGDRAKEEEKAIEEEYIAKVQSGEIEEPKTQIGALDKKVEEVEVKSESPTLKKEVEEAEIKEVEEKLDDTKEISQEVIDRASEREGIIEHFPIDKIHFDPEKFQYKRVYSKEGVTGSLSGVEKYDKSLGGIVTVWQEPDTKKVYVINGHNRISRAKELGETEHAVRFIKAESPKEARAQGAIINISEGSGTTIDAATFFRDSGITEEDARKLGLPMTGERVRKGLALANLTPMIYNAVLSDVISEGIGVVIGEELPNHADQYAFYKAIEGKKLTIPVVKEMAQLAKSTSKGTEVTIDLFGETEEEKSYIIEKAKVISEVNRMLSQDKTLFSKVSTDAAAERLEVAGNIIDVDRSREMSNKAAVIQDVFNRLKHTKMNEALERATKEVVNGTPITQAVSKILGEIEEIVSEALQGGERKSSQGSIDFDERGKGLPKDTGKPKEVKKVKKEPVKPILESKKELTGEQRGVEYQKLHKEMRKKFASEIATADVQKAKYLKKLSAVFNKNHDDTLMALETGDIKEVSQAKLEALQMDALKMSNQIKLTNDKYENLNNKNIDDFDPQGRYLEDAMDLDIVVDLVHKVTGKYPIPVRFSKKYVKGEYDPKRDEIRISKDIMTADGRIARDTLAHELGHAMSKSLKEIFPTDDLFNEALKLSKKVKPHNGEDILYLLYRQAPEEVFADFMATYIIAPGLAKREAPNVVESFNNFLDKKGNKSLKSAFLQAHEDSSKSKKEKALMRKLKIQGMHAKTALVKAEMDYVRSVQTSSLNFRELAYMYLLDKSVGLRKLERKALTKVGERASEIDLNAYFQTKHAYQGLMFILEELRHNKIKPADISYLMEQLKSVTLGKEVARPLGITSDDAKSDLEVIKEEMGEEQYNLALSMINKIQEWWMDSVITPAYEAGVFTDNLYESIKEERKRGFIYKPDSVINKNVTASIKELEGTFDDVKDPIVSMMIKAEMIMRANVKNEAKCLFVDSTLEPLLGAFGEDFKEFPIDENPPSIDEKGRVLFKYKRKGKMFGTYTDKYAAMFFHNHANNILNDIIAYKGIIKNINSVLRGIFVNYNIGYLFLNNPVRDTTRTFMHLPKGLTPLGYQKYLRKSWKHARNRASGVYDDLVREIESLGGLNPIHSSYQDPILIERQPKTTEEYIDYLFRQYNVPSTKEKKTKNPFKLMLKGGTTLENLHKIAMYLAFTDNEDRWIGEGKMFEDKVQMTKWVRDYSGSSNFTVKGIGLTNDVFLFVNSKMQDLVSSGRRFNTSLSKEQEGITYDYKKIVKYSEEDFDMSDAEIRKEAIRMAHAMKGKGVNNKGVNYKMMLAFFTLLGWNLFNAGIAVRQRNIERLLQADEKELDEMLAKRARMWANIPSYERDNYFVVPLRMVEGETLYMRLPLTGFLILANSMANKVIDGLTDKDLQKILLAAPRTALEMKQTMTPAISIPKNWIKFSLGEPVTDPFMGYQILSKDERNVGGWQANKKMIEWTMEQLGMGKPITLYKDVMNDEYRTISEYVRQIPLLGKAFRVTSNGLGSISDSKAVGRAKGHASAKVLFTEEFAVKYIDKYLNELEGVNEMNKFEKAVRPLTTLISLFKGAKEIEAKYVQEDIEKKIPILESYYDDISYKLDTEELQRQFDNRYNSGELLERDNDINRFLSAAVNHLIKRSYPKVYRLLTEIRNSDSTEEQLAKLMTAYDKNYMTEREYQSLKVLIEIGRGLSGGVNIEAIAKFEAYKVGDITKDDLEWLNFNTIFGKKQSP